MSPEELESKHAKEAQITSPVESPQPTPGNHWKKGMPSPNPKGRPPVRSMRDVMHNRMKKHWGALSDSLIEIATKAENYEVRLGAMRLILNGSRAPDASPKRTDKPGRIEVEEADVNDHQS